MKRAIAVFLLTVFCSFPTALKAEEAHHEHENKVSPKGGRVLEGTEPLAEFYLEKDRTATITFYDDEMKPIPAAEQSVTVIADSEGNRATIEFQKKGDVLVSNGTFPSTNDAGLVIQFRQDAQAKPKNFRFSLNENICPECKRAEYGCICGH